jgi:hypothetical protein
VHFQGLPTKNVSKNITGKRLKHVIRMFVASQSVSAIGTDAVQVACWRPTAGPKRDVPTDLLDAPTALAACCGFDLCHKYILYLYLYLYLDATTRQVHAYTRCFPPTFSRVYQQIEQTGATECSVFGNALVEYKYKYKYKIYL